MDTEVSVEEEVEADPSGVSIQDTSAVGGQGEIDVSQSYSGSGGYLGNTFLWTQDPGSLTSQASLTSGSLSAFQRSVVGQDSIIGIYLNEGGAVNAIISKLPGTDIYIIIFWMKWPRQDA